TSLVDALSLAFKGPAAGAATPEPRGHKPLWQDRPLDVFMRLNAGQLITAARSYRDVAIELELNGGRLRLPLLPIAGDAGFAVELEGEVDDALTHPKGALRGLFTVDTPQALGPAIELFGATDVIPSNLRRGQGLTPLRLAGSMTLGRRTPGSADLALEGE